MSKSQHSLELVRATTADGLRLDGVLLRPAESGRLAEIADVAILVHGTGSNFYGSTLMDTIAARLVAGGMAVLRINTRGHDGISTAATAEGGRRQGAAYELVDECRHDLAAWERFAADEHFGRILLLGHSLGAVKSIYALATSSLSAVRRLVAVSPPRLSHSYFLAQPQGAEFQAVYAEALAKLEVGRGDELMEVRFPLPYVVTARGYVDKYGPEERYNVLAHFAAIRVPSLVTFGSLEVQTNAAFRQLPDEIERLAAAGGWACEVGVIAGADHFYSAARDELASRIERWLKNGILPRT